MNVTEENLTSLHSIMQELAECRIHSERVYCFGMPSFVTERANEIVLNMRSLEVSVVGDTCLEEKSNQG
jgi:hypothetical protein